jgi:hypothetical protein
MAVRSPQLRPLWHLAIDIAGDLDVDNECAGQK